LHDLGKEILTWAMNMPHYLMQKCQS
jgi:hypothetical protein